MTTKDREPYTLIESESYPTRIEGPNLPKVIGQPITMRMLKMLLNAAYKAGAASKTSLGGELDASPPIVGVPVAWMTDDGRVVSADGKLHMEEVEHPIGIHYDIPLGVIAAQDPQSSPAPKVFTPIQADELALSIAQEAYIDPDIPDRSLVENGALAAINRLKELGYLTPIEPSPAPGVKPDGIMNEGYIEATRAHASPAPSVIEAGDAMRKSVGDLTIIENAMEDDTAEYSLDDLNNAWLRLAQAAMDWDAAKASRPSVTAPVMSREQLKEVANEWLRGERINPEFTPHGDNSETLTLTEYFAAFASHVLSLSPAAQGVTVDQDWIEEVAHKWAVSQWTEREDMQDQRMTEFGHAVRILRFSLLTK